MVQRRRFSAEYKREAVVMLLSCLGQPDRWGHGGWINVLGRRRSPARAIPVMRK